LVFVFLILFREILLPELNILEIINEDPKLSSLPEIYFQIKEAIDNPASGFEDVEYIIKNDSALSFKLLRIVNSSFYGFEEEIGAISHAISIIGTKQLANLALATTIISVFSEVDPGSINMNSFWRHNVGCGICARTIVAWDQKLNSEKLFLSGILHDIGRLVMLENRPNLVNKALDVHKETGKFLFLSEKDSWGLDHAAVGAALVEHWKLPASLAEMVRYHHDPLDAPNLVYECCIINVADAITKAMEFGSSGDCFVPPIEPAIWNKINLSPQDLDVLLDRVETQFTDVIDFFI
jgi:HD-like signal output (HDOD) protein